MPTLVTQAIGVMAILIGVAWTLWPMRMIHYQYSILYFWVSDPDLDELNPTVARAGGAILAALGVALVVGLLP